MTRLISSISFGKKLVVLLGLPIIAIMVFSGKEIRRDFQQVTEMTAMVHLADLTIAAGDLVHGLQAERGATSLFLTSNGREFGQQIDRKSVV